MAEGWRGRKEAVYEPALNIGGLLCMTIGAGFAGSLSSNVSKGFLL